MYKDKVRQSKQEGVFFSAFCIGGLYQSLGWLLYKNLDLFFLSLNELIGGRLKILGHFFDD